ncbi:MAG: TetR/AcrR family transcriptional regulator [Gammaproteobacteria bacterium]
MPPAVATVAVSPKIRNRQGRTRQRILDESARLFIAKGFENVSVEDIIAAAEIARSSFYRFFSNRDQVLASIIRPVFEQGIVALDAITSRSAQDVMDAVFDLYLDLWTSSPDSLRVSTRVGGVHFYLFEDVHLTFREKLARTLKSVEPSGIFLNGSADLTGRLLARTAVPVLETYSQEKEFEKLFRSSMRGFLLLKETNR